MNPLAEYQAPRGLSHPLLQSMLASSSLRARGSNPMAHIALGRILEVAGGVRLWAEISTPGPQPPRAACILLHGWEGSGQSTYILLSGRELFARGFEVIRLNFRDHGPSHHLNQGVFRASLLEEIYSAVALLAAQRPGQQVFLVGFSLGGNFALRIARECQRRPIPNLGRVVGISPLLDPAQATRAIDAHPLLRGYFLDKWRRSLSRKQVLFPELYDFGPVMKLPNLMAMTDELVSLFHIHPSSRHYFDSYTLAGDDLAGVELPLSLLTARDDPIIRFSGFERLTLGPRTELLAPPHGGHSGFIQWSGLASWYQAWLPARLGMDLELK